MNNKKERIADAINRSRDELFELSKKIHDHPELGFEGFQVQKGYGGLQTAFRADKAGKGKGPNVAFLAEYDALRGIGHGCGHNLIATCSTGAF